MELFVIAAPGGDKVNVALVPSAEKRLKELAAAAEEGGDLRVHYVRKFPTGLDKIALKVVKKNIARQSVGNGWYRIAAGAAKTAIDMAARELPNEKGQLSAGELPKYDKLVKFLREKVLETTQDGLGALMGVTGSKISRMESGELEPALSELSRLRSFLVRSGLGWKDEWLFGGELD